MSFYLRASQYTNASAILLRDNKNIKKILMNQFILFYCSTVYNYKSEEWTLASSFFSSLIALANFRIASAPSTAANNVTTITAAAIDIAVAAVACAAADAATS